MDHSAHRPQDDELAAAWICCSSFADRPDEIKVDPSPVAINDREPLMTLFDLEHSDPVRALNISFLIARASSHPWVLLRGCGPIETLLAQDPTLLDAVEIELQSNPGLRDALSHVSRQDMPKEFYIKIKHLASG